MKRFGLPAAVVAALALGVPALHADEIRMPGPDAKVHTVVTGDTLWDIAQAYLKDPFQWPKIWRDNEQVANPDLIFPGGLIRIPVELLKPEIVQALAPQPEPPKVVEVPVPKGSLNPLVVESAGYITRDVDAVGKVMGTYEGHTLMGQGDTIFLKMQGKGVPAPGSRFTIVRPLGKVRDPGSHRRLGRLVRVLGVAVVTGDPEKTVQAKVERSYDSINEGDRLVPYTEPDVTVTEQAPEVSGYIVASRDDRSINGAGDVVYLDRGSKDGLAPGMVLQVLAHQEQIQGAGLFSSYMLPERELATLRVLSVREGNATARVEHSNEPIGVGNQFRTPPAEPAPESGMDPAA